MNKGVRGAGAFDIESKMRVRVGAYLTTRASTVSRVVPATSLTMDLSVPEDEQQGMREEDDERMRG